MHIIDNRYLVALLRNARDAQCDPSNVALQPVFEVLESLYAWLMRPPRGKSRVSYP